MPTRTKSSLPAGALTAVLFACACSGGSSPGEDVEAMISSAGGVLVHAGGARLAVAPGAVIETTSFRIAAAEEAARAASLGTLHGRSFEVVVSQDLRLPAEISLEVDLSQVPEDERGALRLVWEPIDSLETSPVQLLTRIEQPDRVAKAKLLESGRISLVVVTTTLAPNITSDAPGPFVVDQPVGFPLAAEPPFGTWTTGRHPPPPGLSFDVNGVLTGVPTTAGRFSWCARFASGGAVVEKCFVTRVDESGAMEAHWMAPASVRTSEETIDVLISGQRFPPDAFVTADARPLPTRWIDSRTLRATVSPSLLRSPGAHPLLVQAPLQGSTSAPVWLRVLGPNEEPPAITGTTPQRLQLGRAEQSLEIHGERFSDDAIVLIGQGLPTTVERTPTRILATVPGSMLPPEPGVVFVKVRNEGFDGAPVDSEVYAVQVAREEVDAGFEEDAGYPEDAGTEEDAGFEPDAGFEEDAGTPWSDNPVPVLSTLDPAGGAQWSASITTMLNGSGFVSGMRALVRGVWLPTSLVSSTQAWLTIPGELLTETGVLLLQLETPSPGGGRSEAAAFDVVGTPVAASVQEAVPDLIPASGTVVVELIGSRFDAFAEAWMDGVRVPARRLNSRHLRVVLENPQEGARRIEVRNPGAAEHGSVIVIATSSPPTSPAILPLDEVDQLLPPGRDRAITVRGHRFVPGTVVVVGGQTLATAQRSPRELSAVVPGRMLQGGFAPLSVVVKTPGHDQSNARTIHSTARPARLTALIPARVGAGSDEMAVQLVFAPGYEPAPGSTVKGAGQALREILPFQNGSMTVAVPASLLRTPGTVPIDVWPASADAPSNTLLLGVEGGVTPPKITAVTPTFVNRATAAEVTFSVSPAPTSGYLRFNDQVHAWQTRTDTSVTARLSEWDLNRAGELLIRLFSADGVPMTSAPIGLVVQGDNPKPIIAHLEPAQVGAGTGALTVRIVGDSMLGTATTVLVNGQARGQCNASSPYECPLRLDRNALEVAQTLQIALSNPGPGGGQSTVVPFTITTGPAYPILDPKPWPIVLLATGGAQLLHVQGTGLTANTTATVDGTPVTPIVASSDTLALLVPGTVLTTPRWVEVVLTNAGPGGGTAKTQVEVVKLPRITSITPRVAPEFGDVEVTLTGENFDLDSIYVVLDGSGLLHPTQATATELTATLPRSKLPASGFVELSVQQEGRPASAPVVLLLP